MEKEKTVVIPSMRLRPVKDGKSEPCLNSIGDVCPCKRWDGELRHHKPPGTKEKILKAMFCRHRKMHDVQANIKNKNELASKNQSA